MPIHTILINIDRNILINIGKKVSKWKW